MKTLKSYINSAIQGRDKIDGHIHLFDHKSVINDYYDLNPNNTYVGFMDIDFKNTDKYDHSSVIAYYDNYIKNYLQDNVTLLATSMDPQSMIDLYNRYPDVIKGFGELKCYDYHRVGNKKIPLPYGDLKWIEPLCEFNRDKRLPIYIHWYVFSEERQRELSSFLDRYSEIPFVICHCGMSHFNDWQEQYQLMTELLPRHSNLYVDISYRTLLFFEEDPDRLLPFFGKCLLGTDLNTKSFEENLEGKYIRAFNKLYANDMDYKNTYNKLFR